MKKLSILFFLFFLNFNTSALPYSTEPKEFVSELNCDQDIDIVVVQYFKKTKMSNIEKQSESEKINPKKLKQDTSKPDFGRT